MEAVGINGVKNGDLSEISYDGSYMPQNEFELVNSVIGDGIHKEREVGISALAFDSAEELLWIGTKSGHVTSYFGMHLQKYTSFQVHPRDQIRNLATMDDCILALTNTSLRGQHRRGLPQFTYSAKNMVDMHSLLIHSRNQRVLMSGMQESLIEYDVNTGKQISATDTNGSCAILREHSRFICCGDVPKGKVQLRDNRTLKLAHTLDAHSGTLSDFDVHGQYLVTCGQSLRHGIEHPDRFLMVYDMRILKAVSPIQSVIVPYQLRFLPSMTSQIALMSANGQVQMADTACLSTPNISLFQVDFAMDGCNTISMDISPSNQCLAFGDTGNTVYLYSSTVNPVLNPYARVTEFADPVEQLPPMAIEDEFAVYSSVPRPHLPLGQTTYLTDLWPEKFARPGHRPTPDIDPEVLNTMKIIGTVGYARNVNNIRRNLVSYPNLKKSVEGVASSVSSVLKNNQDKKNIGTDSSVSGLSSVPKRYRKVVVKYSKMGVEDFDFDRYNRTCFCGLEATLPNAYSNSMLQILYFTEGLRKMVLNHGCNRDTCLACELSFLFHMMDKSGGVPCQSSNFLRSLRTIPEASALGIVLSNENAIKNCNVPRLIQSWNRFILQQIHVQCSSSSHPCKKTGVDSFIWNSMSSFSGYDFEEEYPMLNHVPHSSPSRTKNGGDSSSIISQLFGFKQDKVNFCTRCKSSVTTSDSLQVVNMVYPELPKDPIPLKFEDVVCSSLCPEQVTPAWCDNCRKYQPTTISRVVRSLPKLLNINAGCENRQALDWWRTQMELLYKEYKSDNSGKSSFRSYHRSSGVSDHQTHQGGSSKPCRYGLNCTRMPDCKFWHPSDQEEDESLIDIGDRLHCENISWVPHSITLSRHKDETISTHSSNFPASESPIIETAVYDLYGVCCNIIDPVGGEYNNIVACINVGESYHSRIASPVSQWYIFNDFCISTISPQEATWFNLSWKIPCIFVFQRRSEVKEEIPFVSPITSEVFEEDRTLLAQGGGHKSITFIPLSSNEIPNFGCLVAIDAEFVTLNQEESELRSDGKVSLLKAAHVSVARITVVRGEGPLEGTPFIDDYISTQEQVVDYVTRFSGIKPGDLDANSSSKHLNTLKDTYRKLRYLVDVGCVFVGHGLKNDFRVINIVVPPEQIIDTVHLFHLPHNRMVSLKFLSWFFLKKTIQEDTHDSVEDAVTALALYKNYIRLRQNNHLADALNSLYKKGKYLNWKIPNESQ